MTGRTVLLGVVAVGVGYGLWRLPATRRFVATVREAAGERESELRAAVETSVRTDATTRAPRHAADSRVPDLDVDAGWDGERPGRPARPMDDTDPGRSLSRDEARALLLDPAGPGPAPVVAVGADGDDGRAR